MICFKLVIFICNILVVLNKSIKTRISCTTSQYWQRNWVRTRFTSVEPTSGNITNLLEWRGDCYFYRSDNASVPHAVYRVDPFIEKHKILDIETNNVSFAYLHRHNDFIVWKSKLQRRYDPSHISCVSFASYITHTIYQYLLMGIDVSVVEMQSDAFAGQCDYPNMEGLIARKMKYHNIDIVYTDRDNVLPTEQTTTTVDNDCNACSNIDGFTNFKELERMNSFLTEWDNILTKEFFGWNHSFDVNNLFHQSPQCACNMKWKLSIKGTADSTKWMEGVDVQNFSTYGEVDPNFLNVIITPLHINQYEFITHKYTNANNISYVAAGLATKLLSDNENSENVLLLGFMTRSSHSLAIRVVVINADPVNEVQLHLHEASNSCEVYDDTLPPYSTKVIEYPSLHSNRDSYLQSRVFVREKYFTPL